MLNLAKGIDSLTNFKRQTAEYLARLHKTGEPVVLTVNGKAEVVVQSRCLPAARGSRREGGPGGDGCRHPGGASGCGGKTHEAGPSRPQALAKKYGIADAEA